MQKLRHPGHINIVQILAHGWLSGTTSIYFIDMDQFAYNLEHYIHDIDHSNPATQVSKNGNSEMDIIRQVSRGIVYIHEHDEMHGGLKPTNGILSKFGYTKAKFFIL